MSEWREVGEKEFFNAMGSQNVHPQAVAPWPYTSYFKNPYGDVRGKSVDFIPEDSGLTECRYYLPATVATQEKEHAHE